MLDTFRVRTALALLTIGFVGACGGGGGGGGGPQPPPAPTYSIGGTVAGLSGSGLVLQNNGGGNLSVGGNGPFAFAGQLASGGAYTVTVLIQPTTPSQTCTVANGAGSVSGANVTGVAVSCTTNSFAVGGSVSGLAGSGLVLINNGGDDRAINADGAFTFATSVLSGAMYDVRVLTQPRDPVQRCTVANASGAVGAAAVSATVSCVTQNPRYAYALDYDDESISIYAVDATNGQLRGRGHARVGVRPVDGVGAGNGRFVYILNRGSASVSAFTQDGTTGDLTEIAGSPYATGAPGDGAMRITLHPGNRFLYVTNGPANNIAAFRIDDANGALTAVAGSPFAAGSNPFHLAIDGRGAYAYVANRDSGDIYTYRIDANTGALVEVAGSRVSTGAGSGPAVVTLHATGRYAYVAGTNAGNVVAFAVNPSTGVLTHVAGGPYGADANPAETILQHPSGRFLYVRNIGAPDTLGSVSAFSIDMSTGALTAIGSRQAIGVNSSYAWMHPTGRFLLIANRGTPLNSASTSGSISVFSIDEANGALTPAATQTLQPSPFSVSTDSSGRFVYVASVTGNVHYSFTMNQTSGALTPLAYGYRMISRDQPISLIAYSSQTAPQAPTFRSRAAYVANTGANAISAFAVDAATGALAPAGAVASSGAGPRALAVHSRNRFVLSINETGNNEIASHQIATHGATLATAHSTLPTAGSAPVALASSPNGRAVYLAHRLDAAPTPDMIGAYNVDPSTGALTPINNGDFNGMPTFTPPTAVAVAPNGRYMYFTNDTHVGWATVKDSSGGFAGDNGNGPLGAAGKTALAIHPSGRFAYVAIGTDPGAVEVYPIDPHFGQFVSVGSTTVAAGATPRSIAVEPTGRFAYVANAGSASVSMYAVNQSTGALTSIGAPVATGANPVTIVADYSGRYVHVLSRANEQVLTYAVNQSTGALVQLAGAPAATGATPSSLAVTTDVE